MYRLGQVRTELPSMIGDLLCLRKIIYQLLIIAKATDTGNLNHCDLIIEGHQNSMS